MSVNRESREKSNLVALFIAAVIILFPLCYTVINTVFARGVEVPRPFLEKPDAANENCVRDTEYMRFHHWELLREMRDHAVRDLKRGDINLAKCRECHTSRGRFCNECHDAVNLKPDCWGCHYYPEAPESSAE